MPFSFVIGGRSGDLLSIVDPGSGNARVYIRALLARGDAESLASYRRAYPGFAYVQVDAWDNWDPFPETCHFISVSRF